MVNLSFQFLDNQKSNYNRSYNGINNFLKNLLYLTTQQIISIVHKHHGSMV